MKGITTNCFEVNCVFLNATKWLEMVFKRLQNGRQMVQKGPNFP